MDKLLEYINDLPADQRAPFAQRCETTIGYLRKACSVKQKISEGMCLRIATESGGAIFPEDLRPDVDWHHMRIALNKQNPGQSKDHQPQPATQPVAQGA